MARWHAAQVMKSSGPSLANLVAVNNRPESAMVTAASQESRVLKMPAFLDGPGLGSVRSSGTNAFIEARCRRLPSKHKAQEHLVWELCSRFSLAFCSLLHGACSVSLNSSRSPSGEERSSPLKQAWTLIDSGEDTVLKQQRPQALPGPTFY